MSFLRFFCTCSSVLILGACGLDVVGIGGAEAALDGSVPDGGGTTAEASTPPPASTLPPAPPPPPGCDSSSCAVLDPKWKPYDVAIGAAPATCPSGASALVLRTNPAAGVGACGCSAVDQVPPNCVTGQVTFKVGSGCTSTGVVTSSSTTTCHAVSGSLASSVSFASLGPSGGSCTAQAVTDPSKVTTDALTICAAACAGDICGKKPATGFRACVIADGDVPCDAPGFTEKHLAGDSATLACAACTSCKANATCNNVSIDLYTSNTCGTKVFNLPANACTATGSASGSGIGGMIYNATVTPTYEASGPLTATTGLAASRTVCCAP